MQALLLSFILTVVPYTPTLVSDISTIDRLSCEQEARFGATALQNAMQGTLLTEQLAIWDKFAGSSLANKYSKGELSTFRDVILVAWDTKENHANITPNGFGDIIYAACHTKKSLKKVKI